MRLARALQVVAGQRGIVDVARLGDVDCAPDVAARGLAEAVVVGGDGRAVGAGVDPGEARADVVCAEVLVGDVELVERGHDVDEVAVAVVLDDEAAGVDVLGQPHLVGDAQVAAPVEPVEVALAGHGTAVGRGVVQADDRAGVARRSRAGGGLLVHVEGPVSALGELEAGGGADDSGADDDRVVVRVHGGSCVMDNMRPRATSRGPAAGSRERLRRRPGTGAGRLRGSGGFRLGGRRPGARRRSGACWRGTPG